MEAFFHVVGISETSRIYPNIQVLESCKSPSHLASIEHKDYFSKHAPHVVAQLEPREFEFTCISIFIGNEIEQRSGNAHVMVYRLVFWDCALDLKPACLASSPEAVAFSFFVFGIGVRGDVGYFNLQVPVLLVSH